MLHWRRRPHSEFLPEDRPGQTWRRQTTLERTAVVGGWLAFKNEARRGLFFPLPLLLYSRTRAGLEPERKRLNSASKEENSLEGTVGPYAASAKTHKSQHRLAASFLFEIPAFYRHANKARQTSSIHVCRRSSLERAEMGIDRDRGICTERWRGLPTTRNNTHAQRCDAVNKYIGGELQGPFSAKHRYRPVAIKGR